MSNVKVNLSKEELIKILKETTKTKGKSITSRDLSLYGLPSVNYLKKIFNCKSWNDVLTYCGIRPNVPLAHEEYVVKLKNLRPDIKVIEEYIKSKIPILHMCSCGNDKWMVRPYDVLKGDKCILCTKYARRKKHEEYIQELNLINPKIKVIDEYINSNTQILHKCECGRDWMVMPSNILSGSTMRCNVCRPIKRTKTHAQYIKELEKNNPNVIVIEKYIKGYIPILHLCKCGNEWNAMPDNVIKGQNCQECGRKKQAKSHEEYVGLVKLFNINTKVIGLYENNYTPILHHCECGNTNWITAPRSVLEGRTCDLCAYKLTHEEYVIKLKNLRPDIDVLENYIKGNVAILHKCSCGNDKWMAHPSNVLRGVCCSLCAQSKGERRIKKYLIDNNYFFKPEYSFINLKGLGGGLLRFDFAIFDNENAMNPKILVEFDGEQHQRWVEGFMTKNAFIKLQKHDEIKNNFCINNNIKLLRVSHEDFNYIEDILNAELL